jgi:hypothetical protein
MSNLYGTDFVVWAKRQAELLRKRAAGELDWLNIAEEIESLGKSDRRELQSRILTVLQHLMLLDASTAAWPRPGWQQTLIEQRNAIDMLLEDSPSLRREVASIIAKMLPKARELAQLSLEAYREAPRVLLDRLSYTENQVLGESSTGSI